MSERTDIFERVHESEPVPCLPSAPGAPTSVSVSAFLLVTEDGAESSIFVGDAEQRYTPWAARALAAALVEAALAVEGGRVA